MAGTKIDNFAIGDVNLTAIMDTLQGLRQGHFQASLTEMDTTTIPQVAAGSIFDLNGSLVYVDADETIGGTPVDGVTYIKAIYSSSTVSFEWTATAPTFSTSKNGWYGTSASSGHRYIAKMIKASSSYTGKMLYNSSNNIYTYEYGLYTSNSLSWSGSETKNITITFSGDIKALTSFNFQNSLEAYLSINSVTYSANILTVQIVNTSGSGFSNHVLSIYTGCVI